MRFRLIKFILFIGTAIFFLTGCWDQVEIERRATIVGLAVDYASVEEAEKDQITISSTSTLKEEKRVYKVTAQLAVPGRVSLGPASGDGQAEDNVWVVEGYGYTTGDAIQSIQQKVAHDLFFGHLQVIIVSEDVAQEGIKTVNDFFQRRIELRRTIWLAVSQGDAAQTMSVAPKLEQIPAVYLSITLDNAVDMGKFPKKQLGHFWLALASEGQEAMVPHLEVHHDNIKINGAIYFNDDQMVGHLHPHEVIIFNSLNNSTSGGASLMIPIDDGHVLGRSITSERSLEVTIEEGMPKVKIKVDVNAEVREKSDDSIDLDKPEVIKQLNQNANKLVQHDAETMIKKTQENQADIFGVGEQIRAKFPDYWDEHIQTKEKWREIYPQLDIDVEYQTDYKRLGIKAD